MQRRLALRRGKRPGLLALAIAALFALISIPNGPGTIYPDMTEYLNQTYDLLGKTPQEARESTIQLYCGQYRDPHLVNLAAKAPYDDSAGERQAKQCVSRLHKEGARPNGNKYGPAMNPIGPIMSPRYEAIFLSRPGVAVMYAPAVALLPDRIALGVTTIAVLLIGGLLIFLFLRVLRAPPWIALLGQVLYYVLPTARWSMDPLSESVVLTLTAAILLGVAYIVFGRTRLGLPIVGVSFLIGFFMKYSQFELIGAALTGSAVLAVLLAWRAGRPVRPLLIVAATAFAGTVAQFLGAKLLGWPGGGESMQDLLTVHYASSDVPDPVSRWLDINGYYWPWWLTQQLHAPLVLLSWLVAAWGLWWSRSRVAFAVFAIALSGLAAQFGHPEPNQEDRLYVSVWFLVICGIPILLMHLLKRREREVAAADASVANVGPEVTARIPRQVGPATAERAAAAVTPRPTWP